jgi:hypothetical protein
MDLRPRKTSLLRRIAWPGIVAGAVVMGCGPGTSADRTTSGMTGDGSVDGRGGRGGSAQGGSGGNGGVGGAGTGGSAAPDGGGPDAVAGSGGTVGITGGSGGTGGIGGSAGMQGSDGPPEFDVAFAPDLPVDLPVRPDVPPGPPELARGRVGHWKLDEGRGNVALDSSGIGNHGGTVNLLGPDWKPGKFGTALEFTPTRRTFIAMPSHETIGPTEGISISVWVNATSWAGAPRLVQKGEDDIQYSLRAEDGKLRFALRLAAVTAVETALPPVDEWVHVAATYDGQVMVLYQGGKALGMQAASGPIAQPFTSLSIGTRSQAAAETEFFAGLLDEVIIYERALSATEVGLLADGKSP